ncbi:HAD family phosphatase [Bacillus salipaludis]|uniref:HAD family hydrolase n=1 Tax=Bacillus salipaludis TaxID=2547811 RepID=A0A4R5VN24_9BACI|nr:HAD family hydrolase [Bacillus salipaludis]MDQ6599174.1 HAD family hydrolase [Bacillus salipaludis]TDK58820.1 HAD family phosphatase [Bacillus salipaludis]
MPEYKVLFLDVDGTILRPDDTIEASTKEAISTVQEKGIEVFLATGRPLHELDKIAEELNIHSFIGYNGAYAVYNQEDLFKEYMNEENVKQFLQIAADNQHEAVLYTNDSNAFTHLESPIAAQFIEKFHIHKNSSYTTSLGNQILGITLMNLKEGDVEHYKNNDGIHLSQVHLEGLKHCYDVIRDKVNKGIGIQMVLKHLGIDKESSIAFGDGMNDKEMLMSVGEGFAMGNGHPDLFQYAKHKTTEVTNSGIYNGLKKLGLVG